MQPSDIALQQIDSQAAASQKVSTKISKWFNQRYVHLKSAIPFEFSIFKNAWPGIIVGIFWQVLHNWFHNYVFYLAGTHQVYGGPENRLADLGFDLFPSLEHLPFLPSNGCLYALFLIAITFAIRPLFFKCTCASTIQMAWRLLVVCTFTITFRVLAFIFTILPSPAPHCSQSQFTPPTVGSIFSKVDTEGGCSDLIFSSHMMYGSLCCLLVTHYTIVPFRAANKRIPIYRKGLIIFMWCVALAEACFIVAQRAHYTVDVIISLYTVPMTWVTVYFFLNKDPQPSKKMLPTVASAVVVGEPAAVVVTDEEEGRGTKLTETENNNILPKSTVSEENAENTTRSETLDNVV